MAHKDEEDIPSEIDFSDGERGLHHIPAGSMVEMPGQVKSMAALRARFEELLANAPDVEPIPEDRLDRK